MGKVWGASVFKYVTQEVESPPDIAARHRRFYNPKAIE